MRGEALHGVLTRFQHPLFRGSTLKYKVQLAPEKLSFFDFAIETVEHIADAAADVVPVQGRADDEGVRLFHGVDDSIQPVSEEILTVSSDGVVSQIQSFIIFAVQQLCCQLCGVAILLGLPLMNKMLMLFALLQNVVNLVVFRLLAAARGDVAIQDGADDGQICAVAAVCVRAERRLDLW